MSKFKYAILSTEEGTTWDTAINPECSDDMIRKYFMNQYFNVKELLFGGMEKVIKVEIKQ